MTGQISNSFIAYGLDFFLFKRECEKNVRKTTHAGHCVVVIADRQQPIIYLQREKKQETELKSDFVALSPSV